MKDSKEFGIAQAFVLKICRFSDLLEHLYKIVDNDNFWGKTEMCI